MEKRMVVHTTEAELIVLEFERKMEEENDYDWLPSFVFYAWFKLEIEKYDYKLLYSIFKFKSC